jgi:hypothetical protein
MLARHFVMAALIPACSLLAGPISVAPILSISPSGFRVTTFATGLLAPTAIASNADGSILVASGFGSATVRRMVDVDADGVADGPGSSIIQIAGGGAITSMVQAGGLVALGIQGQGVRFFAPTSDPTAPYLDLGAVNIHPIHPRLVAQHPRAGGSTAPGFARKF